MNIAELSSPLFNDGRPVLTVVHTGTHYLDVAARIALQEYRFFQEDLEVTAEVADAFGAHSLTVAGALEAPDCLEPILAYAASKLGDACGFDVILAEPADEPQHITLTFPTLH